MNLHVPQSLGARSECENLMNVNKMLITPQSNQPVMGIVQDSLLGAYLFSREDVWLNREDTMQLLYHFPDWDGRIPVPNLCKPKPLWSGKQLFSCLLPPGLDLDAFHVLIRDGELLVGHLGKKILGRAHGSLIQLLVNDYGGHVASKFIHNLQKIIDYWLCGYGFSTGIGDCVNPPILDDRIGDILRESEDLFYTEEEEMNRQLNGIRDKVGSAIIRTLGTNNGLNCMATSGSKGSLLNITQVSGCLGQQNVEGQRIPFRFRKRTLPHFSKDDYGAKSRGFIQSSYFKGLNPAELFMHAQAGREGLIGTFIQNRRICSRTCFQGESKAAVKSVKHKSFAILRTAAFSALPKAKFLERRASKRSFASVFTSCKKRVSFFLSPKK